MLCYLWGIEKPPHSLPFDLETVTQIFIWGCIRVRRAFEISSSDLALELLEEMMENATRCQQTGHWALGVVLYEMVMEFELFEEDAKAPLVSIEGSEVIEEILKCL